MKTVIIGIGVIGSVHLQICRNMGCNVVAVCDTEGEKVKNLPQEIKRYSDYKKMLDEVKPEVAHICTPHYLHAQMIVECLQRNIHVLTEKPLCVNRKELTEILKAEEKSSAQLGVCLQNRYNEASIAAKEYLQTYPAKDGVGTLFWKRDKAYYDTAEWRGKYATEGGGVMINQAVHTLDLLQWFVGMPKTCVATTANLTLKDVVEVEDTAFGVFGGENCFTFIATNGSAQYYPVEIKLMTEQGILSVTPDKAEINGKTLAVKRDITYFGKCCYGAGHESLIVDFYDCIKTGRKFSIDGKEAANVMKLIFSMYESNGIKVEV